MSVDDAHAAPRVVYSDLPSSGVRIIAPTSRDFAELTSGSMDPASFRTLAAILPYSVIVKNDTGSALIAIAVSYDLKNEAGVPVSQRFSISTLANERRHMLNSGEMAFFTPVTSLNRKLATGPSKMTGGSNELIWHDQRLFEKQVEISVSVDCSCVR